MALLVPLHRVGMLCSKAQDAYKKAAVMSDAKRLTAQANRVFNDGTDSPTSEGANEIELSSNPEEAKNQIAALAKVVTHCQNKACTAKISDKRIKWQKDQIEKGEKSFANGQLEANTNVLCYNCYDKLKKGAKSFKDDGTECKIKSKGMGKQARASIAKAKADKVTRHDEILQSLMDEPEPEDGPIKIEFETVSPADLIKMCKEDKKHATYGAHRGENSGPLHCQLRRHNTKRYAALEPNHAVLQPPSDRPLLQPHEQTNASQRNPSTIMWPQRQALAYP